MHFGVCVCVCVCVRVISAGMNAAVRAVTRMGIFVGAKVYLIYEVGAYAGRETLRACVISLSLK